METPEGWRESPSRVRGEGQTPPTVSSPGREDRKPTTLAVLENSLPGDFADRFPSAGAVGLCYPITLALDFQWMNLGKSMGNGWGNLRVVGSRLHL